MSVKEDEYMLKRLSDYFSGIKMTIVSGVFLVASLLLLMSKKIFNFNINPYLDPAWITIIISGYPLLYLAFSRLIKQKWVSSALLISIAMIASIIVKEIFAAGEVAFIMAIGAILEDKTVEKAKKGLKTLISLVPQTARVILPNNEIKEVSINEVSLGSMIRVLPGEVIPVDGEIISGNTAVDQSIITGESLPVDKETGDKVYCGTSNCNGSIDIKAISIGKDSSLQKMINLVEEAENKKAPTQRIADKWATWLVPIAVLLAIITGVVVYLTIGNENNVALIRAVTILVVFCPCALALATPTSVMAGIGQATKHGVIIKSGEVIEEMGKVNCIAFDKTGTLTMGKLEVSDVLSFSTYTEEEILSRAVSIESYSEHPLGKAIVTFGNSKGIKILSIDKFIMIPGKGVSAYIENEKIVCGNLKYLNELEISLKKEIKEKVLKLRNEGKALIFIADEKEIIGVIALSDVLRTESKEMIRKLKKMDVKTVLLTGDNEITANYFASQVGIDEIHADLLPEEKVNCIKQLQEQGYKVAMIGDGVNDAPALKTANVGIAMGKIGSDITVDAAGISLVNDSLNNIPYLFKLSKSTFNTIKFNITLSMCINFLAIILSSFGVLNPITGALVHNIGSVLIVLNASLVYNRNYIKEVNKL